MATKDFEPSNNYLSHFVSVNLESHKQGLLFITLVFFTAILLVTFLELHFFFHLSTKTITAASSAQVRSGTSAVAVQAIALGLDAATINSIPIFLHGSLVARSSAVTDMEREECCSICLGLFEDDEMVKVLSECLHVYHSDCVENWLKNRSNCPLCCSILLVPLYQLVNHSDAFCFISPSPLL